MYTMLFTQITKYILKEFSSCYYDQHYYNCLRFEVRRRSCGKWIIYTDYNYIIASINSAFEIGPSRPVTVIALPFTSDHSPPVEEPQVDLVLLFFEAGWDWVHLVHRPLICLLYQPRMIDVECGAVDGVRIGREKWSDRRKSFPVPIFHHKSHINWPRLEPGPPRWEASDWLPELWHGQPPVKSTE
jgi:hypothetical protein